MSKYILATVSVDYDDEFDVEGFALQSLQQWQEFKSQVEKAFEDFDDTLEIYFGTNEAICVESYEEWVGNIVEEEISEDEFKTIEKYFGLLWGTGSSYFDVLEYIEDQK